MHSPVLYQLFPYSSPSVVFVLFDDVILLFRFSFPDAFVVRRQQSLSYQLLCCNWTMHCFYLIDMLLLLTHRVHISFPAAGNPCCGLIHRLWEKDALA
jgi:hypothetical protein